MFWYRYFVQKLDNPTDWKEFDKAIVKVGKLGAEYQDFGKRGRCYRIPIASVVAKGLQDALDESWKNVYPLSALPSCIQMPWQSVESPREVLSKMSLDFKNNGHYTDPDGVKWDTSDGIINYWSKQHGQVLRSGF